MLGVWSLVGVGLLLATTPAMAAVALRRSVSWIAVVVLLCSFVAGFFSIASDSYSSLLVFALPMAGLGAITAPFQPAVLRQRTPAGSQDALA